jgi:hypothetical protein
MACLIIVPRANPTAHPTESRCLWSGLSGVDALMVPLPENNLSRNSAQGFFSRGGDPAGGSAMQRREHMRDSLLLCEAGSREGASMRSRVGVYVLLVLRHRHHKQRCCPGIPTKPILCVLTTTTTTSSSSSSSACDTPPPSLLQFFAMRSDGARQSPTFQMVLDLKMDIGGRDVLVVEDIRDLPSPLSPLPSPFSLLPSPFSLLSSLFSFISFVFDWNASRGGEQEFRV